MEIGSIQDIQRLLVSGFREWRQLGDVNVTYFPNGLVLFDYDQKAMYAYRWNYFERVSRGLILDEKTGEIVALPFEKFFSWGEGGRTTNTRLREVTKKKDGSLGILYRHKNDLYIATRGHLFSDHAVWATEFLRRNYCLNDLPDELTLLFEIVYPGNRVVVNYHGEEDLVLIGVRNRFTHADYFHDEVKRIGDAYGFTTTPRVGFASVEEALEAAQKIVGTEEEGWVCRFADGQRFKIKGPDYERIQKLVYETSFRKVVRMTYEGRMAEFLSTLPDDLTHKLREWHSQVETELLDTVAWVNNEIRNNKPMLDSMTPRERASWIKEHYPDASDLFFDHLKKADYDHRIIKRAFGVSVLDILPKRDKKNSVSLRAYDCEAKESV